jgi:hypothetical protein
MRAATTARQARAVALGRSLGAIANGMPKRSRNSVWPIADRSPV